jgi:putative transcriptional regulator
VSVNRSVLEQLIKKPAAKEIFRAYAGYAGWSAGQLEREMLMGGWQIAEADPETIFKKPSSEIWQELNRENETIHIDI